MSMRSIFPQNGFTSHMRSAERGFTLIELLVTLAILSLMATMLLGGVVSAGTLARKTDRTENAADEVTAAQIILRQRLETLRSVARLDTVSPAMDFQGNGDAFDFFSAPPLGDPTGGIQKYRLMLTGTGDLILFHAPELADNIDLSSRSVTGWKAARLLSGVRSIAVSYYGATRNNPERKWRTVWQNNANAPELVRIRIGFAEGDVRIWPDLIIHPTITADLGCDPETPTASCGAQG